MNSKIQNKRIFRQPRYVNDLEVDHFIAPKRANRSLLSLKQKYNANLKKLHNTKKQNKRLMYKVKPYEQLVNTLEDRNLISENSLDFLK